MEDSTLPPQCTRIHICGPFSGQNQKLKSNGQVFNLIVIATLVIFSTKLKLERKIHYTYPLSTSLVKLHVSVTKADTMSGFDTFILKMQQIHSLSYD